MDSQKNDARSDKALALKIDRLLSLVGGNGEYSVAAAMTKSGVPLSVIARVFCDRPERRREHASSR